MWRKSNAILFALLLTLGLSMSACKHEEPTPTSDDEERFADADETIVLETDSEEWRVKLFKEHLTYAEAVQVVLPSPFHIPTREEAATLRGLTYPHDERFITSDGYTFGMPSSSVTKAGQKTKYSVLGLDIRRNVIDVRFAPCSCR